MHAWTQEILPKLAPKKPQSAEAMLADLQLRAYWLPLKDGRMITEHQTKGTTTYVDEDSLEVMPGGGGGVESECPQDSRLDTTGVTPLVHVQSRKTPKDFLWSGRSIGSTRKPVLEECVGA